MQIRFLILLRSLGPGRAFEHANPSSLGPGYAAKSESANAANFPGNVWPTCALRACKNSSTHENRAYSFVHKLVARKIEAALGALAVRFALECAAAELYAYQLLDPGIVLIASAIEMPSVALALNLFASFFWKAFC